MHFTKVYKFYCLDLKLLETQKNQVESNEQKMHAMFSKKFKRVPG